MTSSTAPRRSLDSLFRPRSIAIVGASDRPGSRGAELLENLRSIGYAGTIYPVNPSRFEVAGMPCYQSLLDLPEVPEMVAIGVASDRVLDVVRAAASIGSRGVSVVGAGYAESSESGRQLQASLVALCRDHGIALCGPNCLGVWSRVDHVAYWLAGGSDLPLSGLGLVIQSGALASSLMDPLERRGIAFDIIATIGNEADLTAADYIGEMALDPRIRAIGVVVEAIRDADRFIEAIRTARDRGASVFVMKLGRSDSGRRAAMAHTASIAGEHRVAHAVLSQHGTVMVDDLDVLIEDLVLAGAYPQGLGPNVLYATVSGAGAGLVADIASTSIGPPVALPDDVRAGIAEIMPGVQIANPLDVAMAGDQPGLFGRCMAIAAASAGVDAAAVALNVPFATHPDGTRFYVEQVEAMAALRAAGKPAVAFTLTSGDLDPTVRATADRLGIPVLMGASEAIRAMSSVHAPLPERMPETAPQLTGIIPQASGEILNEVESKRILATWGLSAVAEEVAGTADQAVDSADRIGYPVVLKGLARNLVHKSDVGAVRLNLRSAVEVRSAFADVAGALAVASAPLEGIVVQATVEDGLELLVGVKRDEVFGHVVILGWGGVFVEILRQPSIRKAPVDLVEAHRMIDELPGAEILRGVRGRPAADVAALAQALVGVSGFAVAAGDAVWAIDINPIFVRPAGLGAVMVDATIVTASRQ